MLLLCVNLRVVMQYINLSVQNGKLSLLLSVFEMLMSLRPLKFKQFTSDFVGLLWLLGCSLPLSVHTTKQVVNKSVVSLLFFLFSFFISVNFFQTKLLLLQLISFLSFTSSLPSIHPFVSHLNLFLFVDFKFFSFNFLKIRPFKDSSIHTKVCT